MHTLHFLHQSTLPAVEAPQPWGLIKHYFRKSYIHRTWTLSWPSFMQGKIMGAGNARTISHDDTVSPPGPGGAGERAVD